MIVPPCGEEKYSHDKLFINLPQHRRVDTRSASAGLKLDKTMIPNPSSAFSLAGWFGVK
jgi:hypothetical protein